MHGRALALCIFLSRSTSSCRTAGANTFFSSNSAYRRPKCFVMSRQMPGFKRRMPIRERKTRTAPARGALRCCKHGRLSYGQLCRLDLGIQFDEARVSNKTAGAAGGCAIHHARTATPFGASAFSVFSTRRRKKNWATTRRLKMETRLIGHGVVEHQVYRRITVRQSLFRVQQ